MAMLTSYPMCCGAGIMSNFTYDETEKSIRDRLREAKMAKQWGMLHAITNQNQKNIAQMLEKIGFVKGVVVTNPVHADRTTITQWTFDLHKYDPGPAIPVNPFVGEVLPPPASYHEYKAKELAASTTTTTTEVVRNVAPRNPTKRASAGGAKTLPRDTRGRFASRTHEAPIHR